MSDFSRMIRGWLGMDNFSIDDIRHLQRFTGSQTMAAAADMCDAVMQIAASSIIAKKPGCSERQIISELKKIIWCRQ